MPLFENIIANIWNRFVNLFAKKLRNGLLLGYLVVDGRVSRNKCFLPHLKRAEGVVVAGKSGSGKSSLIVNCVIQDIKENRGALLADWHHSSVPQVLSFLASEERRTGMDFSSRLIVIEPANLASSVGFNPLADTSVHSIVSIASIVSVLKERWGLLHFGPQTEEILRNSLHVLMDNKLTFLELSPLLTHSEFRKKCLKQVTNPEVREYFEHRFDPMSEAMKATVRNPILNKTSEFSSDIHLRHIVGQAESTFSFLDAMNSGKVILLDLNKGLLGKHAATLGSLIFSQVKTAIFRKKSRTLFSLYLDEVQNFITADSELDVLFAEARKFSVGLVTANQFMDQFPRHLLSALKAAGTHIAFQLSSDDAREMAAMFDASSSMAEQLKNLPKRNFIMKTGHYPTIQVQTPELKIPNADYRDLLERSRKRFARSRADVEVEIQSRRPQQKQATEEVLDAWE